MTDEPHENSPSRRDAAVDFCTDVYTLANRRRNTQMSTQSAGQSSSSRVAPWTFSLFDFGETSVAGYALARAAQLFSSNRPVSMSDRSIYLVEGNIGAGKSTLCAQLNTSREAIVVCEHVGTHFIDAFNANRRRFAFALQMTQHTKRVAALELALHQREHATVLDRSIIGDFAFALWNACSDNIDDDEWQLYLEAANHRPSLPPSDRLVIVFLHDDVASCSLRQQRRDDFAIDRDYLVGLEAAHLVVLALIKASQPNVTIVELHWGEYGRARDPSAVLKLMRAGDDPKAMDERRASLKTRAHAACALVANESARNNLLEFFTSKLS